LIGLVIIFNLVLQPLINNLYVFKVYNENIILVCVVFGLLIVVFGLLIVVFGLLIVVFGLLIVVLPTYSVTRYR